MHHALDHALHHATCYELHYALYTAPCMHGTMHARHHACTAPCTTPRRCKHACFLGAAIGSEKEMKGSARLQKAFLKSSIFLSGCSSLSSSMHTRPARATRRLASV